MVLMVFAGMLQNILDFLRKAVISGIQSLTCLLYTSRVFQDPSKGTCPSMTILENLAIADNKGKMYGLGRGTNHARVEAYKELLASVNLGLEDKLHTKVGALSGGQRQTLALLMATMNPIEFLILDEHKMCIRDRSI